MSTLDLYSSKQRQNKQSRADLATSWRTSYPSSSGAYTSSNSQAFSGARMEYLRSIWTDIPNVESSRLSSSFYGERQGNTDAENPSQFNDNNNTSNDLIHLFPSLNYYAQEENRPLAQTLPTEDVEQPLLDIGQVNNPWSQVSNSVNNQERKNDIPQFTWSQIVSGDTEDCGLDSSETDDTLVDKTLNGCLVRYISDSLFTASLNGIPVFTAIPSPKPYTVLKIQNIPWYSSVNDIKKLLLKDFSIPSVKEHPLCIHMLMDRCTGKTCGVAFAEVISKSRDEIELKDTFSRIEKIPLQGRRLRICLSSYDHLREKLFYDWPGKFKDGVAVTPSRDEDNYIKNPDLFVCQKGFQSIQNVCRNFKLCYNRKCPERSFEYLMSIIMHIPWLQTKAVVTWQRDLMYESYKLATDTLRTHISKPLHTIDDGLLSLFVRAALLCDGFTIKQKINILKTSRMDCPEDLINHITEAEPIISPEESIPSTIYNFTT